MSKKEINKETVFSEKGEKCISNMAPLLTHKKAKLIKGQKEKQL